MSEIWKDVTGYDVSYQVSSIGRVRSPHGVRSLQLRSDGYVMVGLRVGGKIKSPKVHRLVAEAFIGARPMGFVTDHKNGDRSDNRAENLQYITHRDNTVRGKSCALKTDAKSSLAGVTKHEDGKSWMAQKTFGSKHFYIGLFRDEVSAHEAYRVATEASCMESRRRRAENKTSSFVGVSWSRRDKKWMAYIYVGKKRTHLGSFDSELEASKSRAQAEALRENGMAVK